MTNSINEIEGTDCLLVIGSNTTEAHPIIGGKILAAKEKGAKLIVIDPRKIQLSEYADIYVRPKLGTNIALINGIMNIILQEGWQNDEFIRERTEAFEDFKKKIMEYPPEKVEQICGVSKEDLRKIAELYAKAKTATIVYCLGITEYTCGTNSVKSLANLAMLTGNVGRQYTGVDPLRGQNNVQGACDMGALPNVLTGYQPVTDENVRNKFEQAWGCTLPSTPGITELEMFHAAESGQIKGLYIFGENPMLGDPNANHVKRALSKLDFLVVQDIFLTETAKLADVVLPGASYAEVDGTFSCTERRVQRVRKAIDPVGNAKPNWVIWSLLAKAMGNSGFKYDSPSDIFNEIARLAPIYGGMSYDRLDSEPGGLQWPCPTPDHPGTPFLHQDKFSKGLGTFTLVDYEPLAEVTDANYPFQLTTGRDLFHYNTGTMTRNSPHLDVELRENYAEVSPADAKKLGIHDGELVKATSARGSIEVKARVSDRMTDGVIFMPFHHLESVTNALTSDAMDPISKTPEYKFCAIKLEKA